ncbi:MAG: prepilin-type N-terminal cleavage/methylation domain-containing protein [Oceanospirillaceae bacterium]|nr:prepilin-type N-terminal cleavage/methylation domain-containing protein [Oceanospirillaceae bacterium]MCP5334566.1 prepilin-type N-terminal cleavage/methylation domain-containing protein [Oceanospirillaceae bacterium]MCP5351400.1 prepilin-type N-terminal cleavage/methylation domain-containing protein [Oceanospirillaceae bacterium]
MRKQMGFTLIELMITVTIIAILFSFAVPAYQKYTARGARTDGEGILLDLIRMQESYFVQNRTYTKSLKDLGYAADTTQSQQGYYTISAAECAGQKLTECVLITATPNAGSPVAGDGNLTLNTLNQRTHNGAAGWPK